MLLIFHCCSLFSLGHKEETFQNETLIKSGTNKCPGANGNSIVQIVNFMYLRPTVFRYQLHVVTRMIPNCNHFEGYMLQFKPGEVWLYDGMKKPELQQVNKIAMKGIQHLVYVRERQSNRQVTKVCAFLFVCLFF